MGSSISNCVILERKKNDLQTFIMIDVNDED